MGFLCGYRDCKFSACFERLLDVHINRLSVIISQYNGSRAASVFDFRLFSFQSVFFYHIQNLKTLNTQLLEVRQDLDLLIEYLTPIIDYA